MKTRWLVVLCLFALPASAQERLPYVPAPPDNPLKGLVPYAKPYPDRFPHSLEFSYLPLSDLVVGPEKYNWQPLENLLNDIASRRHQTIFRIWLEYPGRNEGIPPFLEEQGLKVTAWKNTNTAPFPPQQVRTPDYESPLLRKTMKDFIAEMGDQYDGDPRIGFITAGLLGTWGEWHSYPREELMASKQVQQEVMEAYEQAFQKTPILLRYPAGKDAWAHARNDDRRFGYHDDSFAWATLETGRKQDNWFYLPALKAAGPLALTKWKTSPIGGEIRPEVWGQIFDDQPAHPQAQNFAECVSQTHVTWLMDTGMFREAPTHDRYRNAVGAVQKMGYEFYLESFQAEATRNGTELTISVRNTGIAPFYYDWPIEVGIIRDEAWQDSVKTDWSLTGLFPGLTRVWKIELPQEFVDRPLAIRVVNPLPNGLPLRFANQYPHGSDGQYWPLPVRP